MIQIGGVYTTFCHREGIHLQKYAIEMGGVSRYFFTCIGVRGRFDSPELRLNPGSRTKFANLPNFAMRWQLITPASSDELPEISKS